ncbi:hypothetical protein [Arthrobacter sp. AL12]|uniref:hypothetical protein n=1 Tax=Arthrobacter sp. AL12 TaxID=3042241 RepID=UPI00249B3799|nr:hypothetical protein [Arthrobacter sp. AL12]MDI3211802.1 hypothetical protein [Arthrobacter sp. AL12]
MTMNSACEPWCDEHNGAAGECLTLRCLYSRGKEQPLQSPSAELTALAAPTKALPGFPDRVNTIFIEVSYIPAEEERPEMVLRFRDISRDADSATLSTTAAGLRQLHANLGVFLRDLE